MKWITKLFIFIDVIIVLCFIMVYGPIDKARVFWITTAMETGTHRYFANIFYSKDTIKKVMNENYLVEITDETNINDITIGKEETVNSYTSIYEKQILERNPEDLYKLIEFKYGDFDCYLVAIYDPTRIQAVYNERKNKGQILTDIAKKNEAIVAINGGGYRWSNGYPKGIVVSNGKLLYSQSASSYVSAGFNEEGVLIAGKLSSNDIKKKNLKHAISFGPTLIVNGVSAKIKGTGGSGMNPRTVIAQRKDGIVLFLVVNGYGQKLSYKGRGGVYLNDLIKILERYNAHNAVNMDGG